MVESRFMGSLRTFFQYFCMKVFIIKCVGKIVTSAYVSVNVFLPLKSCLKKKKRKFMPVPPAYMVNLVIMWIK